jgi:hypothetical protein
VNEPDLQSLVKLVETHLADIAEGAGFDKVVSAMADLIEALKDMQGVDLKPIAESIRNMKPPSVTVNVPPQPPAQIHLMPAQQGKWEIRRPGAYGSPDSVIGIIERVA